MQLANIRECLLAFWVIGAGCNFTWAGTVILRDGKTYTGKVELKAGNQVIVTPASGGAVTLQFGDVIRLSMLEAVAAPDKPVERDARLPVPWQQSDIGRVKELGSGAETNGAFTVSGAGWGLWGVADSFHYVYQPFGGDVDIVARVSDPPTEKNPFIAGLTIREDLEARGMQASVMLFPKGDARMSCRPLDLAAHYTPQAGAKAYQWVRLIRAGNLFSGFVSADGENWVRVGTVKVKMSATGCVGLACAATLNEGGVGTIFDHVKVTAQPNGPAEGFGLIDGSLIAGRAKKLDEQVFEFTDAAGVERSVPAKAVSYIFTRPLPPDMRKALAKGREGISLANGDQIECSVRGLSGGNVAIDSVLFGRKAEPLSKVAVVVLRSTQTSGSFSISTRDDSIYRCTAVAVAERVLTVEGGSAGAVRVQAADLVKVSRE